MKQTFLNLFSGSKPPATIPPGWALVPVTPTLAMVRAGHDHTREGVTGVWQAMVKAAPSQTLK